MRKESKILILLGLLLLQGGALNAQEDLAEQDLNTLLEDEPVKEIPDDPAAKDVPPSDTADLEGSEPAAAPETDIAVEIPDVSEDPVAEPPAEATAEAPTEATTEAPAEATAEAPAEAPVETPNSGPVEAPVETAEDATGTETLEPLPDAGSETAGATDDLESIKADIGQDLPPETAKKEDPAAAPATPATISKPEIFDVGKEERELLAIASEITGQISDAEWNEVATAAKVDAYTVVKDDWLFKISKRMFGTGFYYPKIWSLNSFITNPHFIEPGMVLSFTTGSGSQAPAVKLGTFTDDELKATPGSLGTSNATELANFGEDARPSWIGEKDQLEKQGVYFQYASEETMDDLQKAGEVALNREYEGYEPPRSEFEVVLPKNYDKTGFDSSAKIFYSVKEGFYLSTFVTTNIVQDFGVLTNGPDENIYFSKTDHAFVKFDESMNVLPGDKFSIYTASGKVEHSNSDREGYKYSIIGQIQTIRKIRDKWEVVFLDVVGTPQRGDRITAYTPKIERITQTYNSRLIEAAILGSYQPMQTVLSFGDVIYLDRGRADGVEMGNVFTVYGFKDRALDRRITDQPTYKLGELTVITLTDNFATVLVTRSIRDFYPGDIAITKTKEVFLREQKAKQIRGAEKDALGGKAIEELDVELNLENLNDELLDKADKIQLTEDELAELERQEREKSIIKDSEKDLKALERLENEIEQAEKLLNDAKLDEDKLLEQQNLNELEKKRKDIDQDALDEIEENLGKRYIDEELNTKENPFGFTEFDVEEVDELLNIEKKE